VLDFIVAQQEDTFPVRDKLPFKMSTDMFGVPAENFDPSVVSGIIVAQHDVGREIRFHLRPLQCLFDSFGAPFRSEIARNELVLSQKPLSDRPTSVSATSAASMALACVAQTFRPRATSP